MCYIKVYIIRIIIKKNNNKKSQCEEKEKFSRVQLEQYHCQSLCTRVKCLKLSEVPLLCLGRTMEIPLRAKPTHNMNIYDGTNKTKVKRDCTTPLPRCVPPGQGPCQGVISQQVGPVVPVKVPGQGLLLGLLEQRTTRPGQILGIHQRPPEQVNRPHDQPELKKQRQWSHVTRNKEVMYCYYMAIKDKPRGYQKRMHQQWKDRGNIECTEQ